MPVAVRRLLAAVVLISGPGTAPAAVPDLTAGGVPDNTRTINLGPTGMRGWVYHVNSGGRRADTGDARQILVTAVAAGSPASGILAADDVILGANGTGAAATNFTHDARRELADAINAAEARDPATLSLLRWRAGAATTVTITLQHMGAYSSTAPYHCPKSARILRQGLAAIMAGETSGRYSFGTLSLLAANDPADPANAARMARARDEARAQIPTAAVMQQMMSDQRDTSSTWQRGHTLILLAEYHLLTGDPLMLPAVEAYAVNIARNSSLFGTMGHIYAEKNPDGSDNGPMGGVYGPVNNAGMPCYLGLILARECGVNHPAVAPMIERMNAFYGGYIGKGTIPYGEHEPAWDGHENNGKSGLAALAFTLQDGCVDEGRYYAKMATAAAADRELGHTGAFFSYLWAPLGAACGGDEAAASHFSRIRWMLDLNRRWDHRFDYDCLNGEGPNSGSQYNDFRMSTAALLTYALPLRQLRITGRNHNPARWLDSTDVAQAAAADGYKATSSHTVGQLVSDLASWSPCVQRRAAEQLATRSIDAATLNQLTALANDPNGSARYGACLALGKNSNSTTANARAATLAALLTDPENRVRYIAAEAMRYLPQSAKMTQLNAVLAAAVATARPLSPFDSEDPLQFDHGRIAMLLFYGGNAYGPKGMIWNNLSGVDRSLLYPAIRAVAANPVGQARSCLYHAYLQLTAADVNALAGTIVDSVKVRAPSDKMFSSGVRRGGIEVLEKYRIAEGVPLSMIYAVDHLPSNDGYVHGLAVLKKYAGSSTTVTPDPDVIGFCQALLGGSNAAAAQEVLNAIAADPDPAALTPFKGIQAATADAPLINLQANQTTLRVTAGDLAQGDTVYTWRKVHGAGNATFTPNGTATAGNCVIRFDNVPGRYLFEVTMSDSRGLTEVYRTVPVTLRNPDGTLPVNDPPVAHPQVVAAAPASVKPITLVGTDPEGLPLLFSVVRPPARGRLSGTAPDLAYVPDPGYLGSDSFTFEVMDSEGQVASATVDIEVSAAGIELHAYEGFDYAPGLLAGRDGGSGMSGSWADGPETPGKAFVFDETTATTPVSYTSAGGPLSWDGVVDNLPTSPSGGARYVGLSAADVDKWEAHRPLARSAGEMAADNDHVLWVSAVSHYKAGGYGAHFGLALATNCFTNRSQNLSVSTGFGGSTAGNGIGVGGAFNNDFITPVVFQGGNIVARTTAGAGALSTTVDNIVILKFVFGETDTVHACRFLETEALDEGTFDARAVSASAVVDENTLNRITFSGVRGAHAIDEIRIGNSFAAVIGVQGPPPDTTPPVLSGITDDRGGETMSQGMPVVFALRFSEAMDVSTIQASDFGNAGTASITIGPVIQSVPGLVTVTVTPVTPGSLQFRVLQGASLTDLAGNPLDTSMPLSDDTVITVNPAMIEAPFVVGMTRPEAEASITGSGLAVGTIGFQNSAEVAEGTVMNQTPAGGASLAPGAAVDLVVSLGPAEPRSHAVQSLAVSGLVTGTLADTGSSDNLRQSIREVETTGTPASQRHSYLEHRWRFEIAGGDAVRFQLEAHHSANTENDDFTFSYSTAGAGGPWTDMLTVTRTSDSDIAQSFTMPPDITGTIHVRVIDTNRSPGRRVLDTIFIDHMYFEVGGAGPMAVVPDLTGLEQSAAASTLAAAGLGVGTVTTAHHAGIPAGAVISQDPAGGTSLAEGSEVDLLVSLGPVMKTVPNLVGLAQSAAESALAAAQLGLGTVATESHASIPVGHVIRQDPAGGTGVPEGSSVNLVVSGGPSVVSDVALADVPVSGSVVGTHVDTHASDDVHLALTEVESTAVLVSDRFSHLEHKWEFNVTGGDVVTFMVEGHHTPNNESDDFLFAYSVNGADGTYHDMFMVTRTRDRGTPQRFVLPPGTRGTVHVRVRDTNRSPGRRSVDTLFIDDMRIRSESGTTGVTAPADEVAWAASFGVVELGGLADDYDKDGMSNGDERIWGLDPTRGSSRNPILDPPDRTTGVFRYTRRDRALTGLTYTIWTSPDLVAWTEDAGAGQLPGEPDESGVLVETVTLSPGLLEGQGLFVQVRAAP